MTEIQPIVDVQAEVLQELPTEFPNGTQESYSSTEIAVIIGTTDRTVRNYVKKVKEIYYWLALTAGTRYTHQCLELIKDLKQVIDSGTSYQDYKAQVWKSHQVENANSTSLAVIPDHRLTTAETIKVETQHTITQQQSRFNGIRSMVRQQLKAQAELDATEDGRAYIETYMNTLNNVVSGHQNLGK